MGLPIIGLQIKHIVHVLLKLFSNILETKCGLLKEVVANSTLLDLNIQNMEMLYVLNTDMLLYAGKKLCEI
jgi:hypothetical protein